MLNIQFYKWQPGQLPEPCEIEDLDLSIGSRRIAKDTVKVSFNSGIFKYNISTVFLGLNHSISEKDPVLFETMVFENDSFRDVFCKRYSTEEQARQGHLEVVEHIKLFGIEKFHRS